MRKLLPLLLLSALCIGTSQSGGAVPLPSQLEKTVAQVDLTTGLPYATTLDQAGRETRSLSYSLLSTGEVTKGSTVLTSNSYQNSQIVGRETLTFPAFDPAGASAAEPVTLTLRQPEAGHLSRYLCRPGAEGGFTAYPIGAGDLADSTPAFSYDRDGLLIDGDSTYSGHTYNAAGQLTSLAETKVITAWDPDQGNYTYESTIQHTYTYDARGLLTRQSWQESHTGASGGWQYTYDQGGNLLTACQDELTYYGSYTFSYDQEGNLLSLTLDHTSSGDGIYTLRYLYDDSRTLSGCIAWEGEETPGTSPLPDGPDSPPAPTSPDAPLPFRDVAEGAYYAPAVRWAVACGLTTGTGADTFSPDLPCTRGQVVTFLWRAMGSPAPVLEENPFGDVASGDFFRDGVLWAYASGITAGTGEGAFSPQLPCTRGQVVTFLWRAMGSPDGAAAPAFGDVTPQDYFAPAVAWGVEQGITTGTGEGTFSPDAPCSRGQIVTFLSRAFSPQYGTAMK